MYQHLLVALDGSEAAEAVLDHAVSLATAFHAQVTLLRATVSAETLLAETSSPSSVGDVGPVVDPTPILDAERETIAEYLTAVADRLRSRGVAAVAIDEPEGSPAEVIVSRATELGVSLLLMTTRGRSGLGRMVFGSVADSVLRHAPCPVLLVRVPHPDHDHDHDDEHPAHGAEAREVS